jgi:hypothetical protein
MWPGWSFAPRRHGEGRLTALCEFRPSNIGIVATMKLCAALTLASLSTALAQNPAQTLSQNPVRPTVGQDVTLTSHSTLVLVPALGSG